MHEFRFRKKSLYCEQVRVSDLARKHKTPLFVYSYQTLMSHLFKLQSAFQKLNPLICYSVKANSNLAILKSLVNKGAGLDIVSGGELYRAISAGCPAEKIVYASVGKTDREIEEAIRKKILFFNVESFSELKNIDRISRRLGGLSNIALRINPDVEPKTHKYITTGKITNKFGIDFLSAHKILLKRGDFPNIKICGLHIHIGSQITSALPYVSAIAKVAGFIERIKDDGIFLEYLNIGGGLGIIYNKEEPETAEKFAGKVIPLLAKTGLKIILEPGRFIVGNAGILVAKVLYVKTTPKKKFVIVDAGMNDLIRPALYEAYHAIVPLDIRTKKQEKVDVVGPICESADCFAKGRVLPALAEGDTLAIMSAGAYGFSMSSNYNSRPRAGEILVVKNKSFVVRDREEPRDLTRKERIPGFLKGA